MKKVYFLLQAILILACCADSPVERRILFIGDSITDGNWGQTGGTERNLWDQNHIYGHGYVYNCISRMMADYPQDSLQCFNRGVSGNTIADLRARWQEDALNLHPDVVSILIGINDVFSLGLKGTVDTVRFSSDYRQILNELLAQNPSVRIVVCEPFVFPVGERKEHWDFWSSNCRLLSEATKRIASEYNVRFIAYQRMFDSLLDENPDHSYWMWDGVHPTAAGHYKMAELWMK